MLHRSIYSLYICKANNNVRKGRGFKKVPHNCKEITNRSLHNNKALIVEDWMLDESNWALNTNL